MNPLLLTGFEPFGVHAVNPSWQIAQALHGLTIGGLRVHSAQLPCVFGRAAQVLQHQLHEQQPVVVVCLGLAGSRSVISIERVAVNLDDARIPDNAGGQPIDQAVHPGGPVGYWSTLPVRAMVQAVRAGGWPAELSMTAGTYVCNHVFYALMHAAQSGSGIRRAGFVHVPDVGASWPAGTSAGVLAERRSGITQVAAEHPRWTLDQLVQAVACALQAAADFDDRSPPAPLVSEGSID